MNKKIVLGILIAFIANALNAQASTKFWIKLADKTGTPYSVGTPTAFLTQKSVDRRTTQSIAIDQTDLPVTPAYITQIDNITNVQVLYASKWLNSVAVVITSTVSVAISTATNAINSLSFVVNTNPTNKFKIVFEKEAIPEKNNEQAKSQGIVEYYGVGFWQAQQLNAVCLHGYGYKGQGMTIAVLDAGFNNANILPAFDSLFARGGVLGTRDFVTGGNSVYEDNSHGMSVLSCMAACVPSVMVGTAPQANYWLLRTEDASPETPSEEYNWIRGAEFADSVGVDILTTSLGYTTFDKAAFNHTYTALNGKTYHMSIASTMAVRKGMFVLNSAGNDGTLPWQFIGVPADADSICTVGAIDSLGSYASFSSKGPTADGRIKPDLVARGANAWVANTSGGFNTGSGTSFACPVLAGAVACFWQRHNTFKTMKVLDTLRKTASNKLTPNNTIGWGIPNMCVLPVSVKELPADVSIFKVFPNPTNNKITMKIIKNDYGILNAEIFNIIGGLLKTVPIVSNETIIDLSSYANGVYFIKVNTKAGSSTQRVVKE
ncbi:MAG: S8 family serine peptidase [Bacteroidota bacterium]|nr:S8 family serine peptidase [Bacteroidota bacterium]